jgi:4a-hydroxytetrahydrobiopterin dehydratase
MTALTQKYCMACEAGTPPLPAEHAQTLLAEVPGWTLAEQTLTRKFRFKDFREAMAFVNRVADLAEAEGHHPDFFISWNRVRLDLTTHAIKGLSENDFILAAKINAVTLQIFANDEAGYTQWMHSHVDGFVLNAPKESSSGGAMLHKATCLHIAPAEGWNYTLADRIKVCSLYQSILRDWARAQSRALTTCKDCNP